MLTMSDSNCARHYGSVPSDIVCAQERRNNDGATCDGDSGSFFGAREGSLNDR